MSGRVVGAGRGGGDKSISGALWANPVGQGGPLMRSGYLFGFAAAPRIAGPPGAPPFTSGSLPPTGGPVFAAGPGTGRVNYLLPPVSRGPAGQPVAAQPETALPQSPSAVTVTE